MSGNRRSVPVALALALVGAGVLVPLSAGPAAADPNPVITVTTAADVVDGGDGLLSLREAVDLANATAGADTIALAPDVSYPLTICDGSFLTEDANVSGDLDATDVAGLSIVTDSVDPNKTAEIVQTCPSRSAERIIQSVAAPLTLSHLVIRGGWAGKGAAIYSTGALTLDRDYVAGNHGDGSNFSAAVDVDGGSASVADSIITGTVAAMGLAIEGSDLTATASITGSTISDNSLPHGSSGGVVDARGGQVPASTPLVLSNSTITRNSTGLTYPPAAGGLLAGYSGATVTGSTISDNVGFQGGGVRSGGTLAMSSSTIRGNRAVIGAGISADQVALDGVTVVANTASIMGGGLAAGGTISRSIISANRASFGGGIGVDGADVPGLSLTVNDSTIAGNIARQGGGIGSANSASTPQDLAPVSLAHDTIVDNVATLLDQGNDLAVGTGTPIPGTFTLGATALGSATAGGVDCALPPGVVASLGSNASLDASCGLGTDPSDQGGAGDLGLVAQGGVPGPPEPTIADHYTPAFGSPLRDAIPPASPLCTGTDQIGNPRPATPSSNCDIGSIEAQGPVYADSGTFVSLRPARVLDTRSGVGNVPTLHGGLPERLTVAGAGGVPLGASAVVLNLTATNVSVPTFVTAFPGDVVSPPVASNLNVVPGQTVPNLVTVKVGKDGKIAFAIGAGSVDLVGDVVGYYQESFPPQSSLSAVSPTRVLDTRPGSGHLGFPTLGSGQVSSLVIPGAPAGATSAVLNVTVTNPTASGFATVFPTAGPPNSPPGASNLNFVAHQTVANLVIAKLGVGGSVSFFNSFGSTDLVVDVVGWYTTAGTLAFTSVNPVRLLDSREPGAPITRMAPGNHRDLLVANGVTVPADAKAVLVNVTAVNPGAPGYLTVYPTGPAPNPPPLASNLNFTKGAIVPNLVVATLSANGKLSIYNGSTGGSVDVIV
ncbi:MAG TPA: hypothetical protein VIJ47_10990, partial [Acidimicrobiales bacterium]